MLYKFCSGGGEEKGVGGGAGWDAKVKSICRSIIFRGAFKIFILLVGVKYSGQVENKYNYCLELSKIGVDIHVKHTV